MPKLTKRNIDKIQPPARGEKDFVVWDDDVPGFGLRVKPTGVKSFVIQYRNAAGQSRRMTIGRHGVITADQARKNAKAQFCLVAAGKDPAKSKRDLREAPTMKELTDDYMERHSRPNKRAGSIKNDQSMIDQIIIPKLGTKKVADINRRDIETLHKSLAKTPYRANRVRALLSNMFSIAGAWEWRADNPVVGIQKYQEQKRDRWLSHEELKQLFKVLDTHPNQRAANIVRLLLHTGARKSEVMGLTWDQIDLDRGVWTKPAHTTKQKKTEHIPLSETTKELLSLLWKNTPDGERYVFPGDAPGKPVQDIKKFWRELTTIAKIEGTRIHDLRHTYASHLVSAGVPLYQVGKLLGHTQSQTTERYAHLADDPLRIAANTFPNEFS
jgi:integrase